MKGYRYPALTTLLLSNMIKYMIKWKGWKAVLRDVFMIWILTYISTFIIANYISSPKLSSLYISNFISGSIGFCISGCITLENRWKHLFIVAVFFWLISEIINIFLFDYATSKIWIINWIKSIAPILIMMGIGGAISFQLVKPNQ